MLAMALHNPDLALEEEEAKRLAKAYVKMQAHYGVRASAKVTDTLAFVMVAGAVYGPRALPYIKNAASKKKAPKPQTEEAD
jgi:hypothetical protein